MSQIENERVRREQLRHELIAKGGPERVSPTILRAIGIFGGAQ